MILGIQKGSIVKAVQQHFNSRYPYLKIELFKKIGDREELVHGNELFASSIDTFISIDKQQTVAKLEQDFLEKTSIKVKVFRRFCNVWIETTLTNDWTLEQQNQEGKLLSELNANIPTA